MSYYGISYSIPNLSGDRYLNFMIGGGIELGAYLLAYVVLNGIGRKFPLMVSISRMQVVIRYNYFVLGAIH